MEKGQIKFRLNNEEATFNICRSMRKSGDLQSVTAIFFNVESSAQVQIEKRLGVEALEAVIKILGSVCIEEYGSLVAALDRGDFRFRPKKFDLDMKHREYPPSKPSIEDGLKFEINTLPPYLRCMYSLDDMTLFR